MESESKAMEVLKRGPVSHNHVLPHEPKPELAVPADQPSFLAFEELVSQGKLIRLDDSAQGLDGNEYPVYRKTTHQEGEAFLQELCAAVLEDLEREGELVKTGEFRLNRNGHKEPVYRSKALSKVTPGDQYDGATPGSASQ
jgi:hypothetical protein